MVLLAIVFLYKPKTMHYELDKHLEFIVEQIKYF